MWIFKRAPKNDGPAPDYIFTEDWFSWRVPVFERHLSPLVGKRCQILEIGTFEGRSTFWLLENILVHPKSKIITVDAWPRPNFEHNLRCSGAANKVEARKELATAVIPTLKDRSIDFAYVDGDHSSMGTLADGLLVFPKMKIGGIIAFDDYGWGEDGQRANDGTTPKAGIDLFLSVYESKIHVLEKDYQVWVKKIRG